MFYKPGGSGTGEPIFTGSAATGLGIPQPGAVLTVNEFGLDQTEESWMVKIARAVTLKPEPRDPHPYLPGMYCVSSTSIAGEALMSTVRAIYKGLVKDQVRPAARFLTVDTRSDTIKLPNGFTAIGGGGFGDGGGAQAQAQANILEIQGIPVPQPVFTLRGATAKEPDTTLLGTYFQSPPRAPKVLPLWEYPVTVTQGDTTATVVILQYKPCPLGWLLDKQEWSEAALHYEVTQQFRMDYRIYRTRKPTAEEQQPPQTQP